MHSRLVALVLSALCSIAVLAALGMSQRTVGAPQLGPSFTVGKLYGPTGWVTALAFGPDGRLYVGSLSGIRALTLDSSGMLVEDDEAIANDVSYVLGLLVQQGETGPVVYASNSSGGFAAFPGGVSTFTAPDWTRKDIITGLPRSPFLELTNALAFRDDGTLLIAEGGLHGATHTPLAGAILVADLHAPGFDGEVTYDPPQPTTDTSTQMSGDVRVYASGFKNPYGMIVHSNGRIYATDNGGIGPDELNLVEDGKYYGEPNLNRAHSDPRQATFHPGTEPSNEEYTAPISAVGHTWEGLAEYTSDAFDGTMRGDLIIASLDGQVWRIKLTPDGNSVSNASVIADFHTGGLRGALSVAVGPTGIIYVGTAAALYYLEPNGFGTVTPTRTPFPSQTLSPPTNTATRTPLPPTPTPTSARTRPGDVNCDGKTTSLDAALILQFHAGLLPALACQQNGDPNHDGAVDSIDALWVLQCTAGLGVCQRV